MLILVFKPTISTLTFMSGVPNQGDLSPWLGGLGRYLSNDLLGTFLSDEGAKRLGTPALAQCFPNFLRLWTIRHGKT